MSRATTCPDKAVLERLRDGSLAKQEQRAVEKHCGGCDTCQATLEELAYDAQGNPSPIACPRPEVLKQLLDGSLGDYAAEAVEHHVSMCRNCEAHFSALCSGFELESRSAGCPRPEVLKRYLDGSLAPHAAEAVEHHMSTCKSCKSHFSALCWGFELASRSIACPRPEDLKRFLDGSLDQYEHADVEGHLETCESCQARLDEVASGGLNLQGQMRNLRSDAAADAPGLKRVIGVLKEELEPDMDTTRSTVSVSSDDLEFLDPADAPGDLGKLGPYRVQEVLGQGGMGIVMKAFDPTLHRAVAIKILAPQLAASSPARQRFAREARAAAGIRNEHVVAIHSVDEWKGLPYLVMEYIPGSSLQARIDRTASLDLNSILRIGMQAATGLAAAHAQGLVHRDIKPSNILLENCVERVKITDFGLARAVDDASLTQSGVVAGTPLFMAPEQARCEAIDHRADLFSLGAVLYAMCTGRSPFRASTTLGVLRRVCDDTHRPIQEVNPDVPNWLSQIVDKLLAKDRENRYQTAEEVVDVLGRHLARRQRGLAGSPDSPPVPPPHVVQVAAAGDDVGPAKDHRPRRRWIKIIGALIVLLAGLFVIAEVIWVKWSLPPIPYLLGLRKPVGLVIIHMPHPEFRVFLNGHRLVPDVRMQTKEKVSGGYLVDVYREDTRITRKWFDLDPGMMVELEVLKDGSLEFQYEGPVRSPALRLPAPKASAEREKPGGSRLANPIPESLGLTQTKGLIVVHLSNPELSVVVNDKLLIPRIGTHCLTTEPPGHGTGYSVEVFKEGIKIANEYYKLKPGMMVELEVLKDGSIIYGYVGPIRSPLLGAKPEFDPRPLGPDGRPIGRRSPWQWQPDQARTPQLLDAAPETGAHQRLIDRINQAIRDDPLAMSLAKQIKSTKEDLFNRAVVRRGFIPAATVELQKRLEKLSEDYTKRVQLISDQIREQAPGQ